VPVVNGGNVSWLVNNFALLGGKWLELLKQAVPRLTRVALVFDRNSGSAARHRSGTRSARR
jgi:hypothetical protein